MIPDDVNGLEIDRAVKSELRTLSKENAQGVGAHLIMVARLLDEDIDLARAHADAAVRRAGRVPSVREARGMVAYQEGDWQVALSEFRTARRLSGSDHLLPYLIDCERALGRPEKALELSWSPEAQALPAAERAEIAVVVSGIRRDMGQPEAAVSLLEGPHLRPGRRESWAPRLYYAYAEALLDLDRTDEARRWFQAAADVDEDLQTDAWERLDELDGTVLIDLDEIEADADAGMNVDATTRDDAQDGPPDAGPAPVTSSGQEEADTDLPPKPSTGGEFTVEWMSADGSEAAASMGGAATPSAPAHGDESTDSERAAGSSSDAGAATPSSSESS